jgi:hypothetical protein
MPSTLVDNKIIRQPKLMTRANRPAAAEPLAAFADAAAARRQSEVRRLCGLT